MGLSFLRGAHFSAGGSFSHWFLMYYCILYINLLFFKYIVFLPSVFYVVVTLLWYLLPYLNV